ncbi:T9SS type A sorting domain-containing protein [Hymenobacter lutimineralis]|uniref:phospholipase D n=1 Tax=Hymenobacter lutimineralis TaxID=2606448 RepID=A0A5D6VI59_9BACT|nr:MULTISPECIES: phospholipase D-like domain-containing protein [Hymenobacter]QIX60087.1 T9SS type A sorting domain-containing protein [Hymenobacter sp. BT18]TYZ14479.1 T9SS type A sorting domain-containing protein [Hymenobacter lutimineralis]
MKKFTLLALLCGGLASQPLLAQSVSTIAEARAGGVGKTVTVRGIVTNGPELGVIRYLQDKQAGLAAYSASAAGFNTLVPGDSIEITGTLKDYNGLLEMDPVTKVEKLASGKTVTPVTVSAAQAATVFAEAYESRLVRIDGNSSVQTLAGATFATFGGNTNYRLNGQSNLAFRVNNASTGTTGIVGKPAPAGQFDVIGIMSQFTSSGSGGYQLLPRLYADFRLGGTPNLTAQPMATSLTKTGFTVVFSTENPGSTKVEYGLTPTLGKQVETTTATTTHSTTLTDLEAGRIYYVRVSSTNAVGTTTSSIVPMATVSNSTGDIKVYFNRSVDVTKALPNNAAKQLLLANDDTLIKYIERARKTIDVAAYSFNMTGIKNIPEALNAAFARGVRVRVVYNTESGAAPEGILALNAGIGKLGRNTARNIMHNKFLIFDAEDENPNKAIVWTGSMNLTGGQMNTDPNSAVIVQDQTLARTYQIEFEEMFGSSTDKPGAGKFGPDKQDNTPHHFLIGGRQVEQYFSPSDNVNTRLLETIGTADHDLHVGTMLITRSDLVNAIRERVEANGIKDCTEVLVDNNTDGPDQFAALTALLGDRAQVYSQTQQGIFHHKYVLVDAGAPDSDPTTWVGSHNWSNSAANGNDENTLVIHDNLITNQYYQEFAARMAGQTTKVALCDFVVTGTRAGKLQQQGLQVYPNPARGAFSLKLTQSKARTATITLRDATGREVLTLTKPLAAGQDLTVDATGLRPGLYLVQVVTPEATQVSRVVVQ